jgi:hypothetical protein
MSYRMIYGKIKKIDTKTIFETVMKSYISA